MTSPHPTRKSPSSAAARWVGLGALVALAAAVAGPYVIAKARGRGGETSRRAAPVRPSATPADRSIEAARVSLATRAVASLAAAVGTLKGVETRAREAELPADPPDPGTFASPTACVRSYLPDMDIEERSLDFLCAEADLWTLERRLQERIAHRPGEGVKRWTRLGPFSLAAVAMVRSGCCVSPEAPTAVVPTLACGILRDKVRAIGAAPALAAVAEYETAVTCLASRGVHLPPRWAEVPPERARAAWDELRRIAWARGRK